MAQNTKAMKPNKLSGIRLTAFDVDEFNANWWCAGHGLYHHFGDKYRMHLNGMFWSHAVEHRWTENWTGNEINDYLPSPGPFPGNYDEFDRCPNSSCKRIPVSPEIILVLDAWAEWVDRCWELPEGEYD